MNIKSESIADYINLKYDIESIQDINDLNKVEELVINSFDYSMKRIPFYPNELNYFRNLKSCTFLNFEITDELVNTLNLCNIHLLILNKCIFVANNKLYAEQIYIENSKVNIKKINAKELVIIECGTIDAKYISSIIQKLKILNCNIINANCLKQSECEIIGCSLDDNTILKLSNIKYNSKEYQKIL